MPQAKGTIPWLTNVKQSKPLERVKIDHSKAKIENRHITHEYSDEMEGIWMEHYRNKADIHYEMKQAREEAERWRRMKSELQRNRKQSAKQQNHPDRNYTLTQQQLEINPVYTVLSPDGEVRRFGKQKSLSVGVSNSSLTHLGSRSSASEENSAEESVQARQGPGRSHQLLRSNFSFSHPKFYESDEEDRGEVFPAVERHKLSRSSSVNKGTSRKKSTRPKSTSAVPRSRNSFFSKGSAASRHEDVPHFAGQHGRSFKDLKEGNSVDKLAENAKVRKQLEIQTLREEHQAAGRQKLEKRIRAFYVDLELFKRTLTPLPPNIDQMQELSS